MPCERSDQYALGIVVYEWLSGNPPFWGKPPFEGKRDQIRDQQIIEQHLTSDPELLCGKVKASGQEMQRVVFQALEKDPRNRYKSVTKFAQEFEKACYGGERRAKSLGSFFHMHDQEASEGASN